ncbi:MAG: Uma2 family endonuclease [Candidatus Competibacteraceae bacterium]|jgi:Uma2 family endonuclease|nr:Uma2 family endonuclease [Candidatus Competibacteraceae bacterium]
MSAIHKLAPITVETYLALEENSSVRHELVDGYLVAMVGTTQRHNLIAGNWFALLRAQLRGTPCRVFMSDLKVQVGNNFYYPDLVVSCRTDDLAAKIVADPKLIIEVLSTSTEARDRHEKRIAYQRLDSVQEYLLVTQDRQQVEVFRRRSDGWEVETYGTGETVRLEALNLAMTMAAIYEDALE